MQIIDKRSEFITFADATAIYGFAARGSITATVLVRHDAPPVYLFGERSTFLKRTDVEAHAAVFKAERAAKAAERESRLAACMAKLAKRAA